MLPKLFPTDGFLNTIILLTPIFRREYMNIIYTFEKYVG